jgi:hypothetical protein
MRYRWLLWLLPVFTVSCTLQTVSAPPASVSTVAVLPPHNRTGDPLLVTGSSLPRRSVFRDQPVTIADMLAAEVYEELEQRGFTVIVPQMVAAAIGGQTPTSPQDAAALAARGQLTGSALYLEIRQWEPADSSLRPWRVLVALDASVIDVATGRVVWTAHLPLRPVQTSGAVTRADAYTLAAHEVARELFAAWSPEWPAS